MISLLVEIERVLLQEWDPIGVRDLAAASNEYDSYAFEIYACLQGATPPSAVELSSYLAGVQSERMGLPCTSELNDSVAASILRLIGR